MSNLKKGFTLVELLVVIALIGVLSTLLLANFNAARERSRDAARKSDIRSIETALRLFYNDYGYYPESDTNGQIKGCGVITNPVVCEWGEPWLIGSATYINTLPTDPSSGQSYRYVQLSLDTYTLAACLENKSDQAGKEATTDWCPSGWQYEVQP